MGDEDNLFKLNMDNELRAFDAESNIIAWANKGNAALLFKAAVEANKLRSKEQEETNALVRKEEEILAALAASNQSTGVHELSPLAKKLAEMSKMTSSQLFAQTANLSNTANELKLRVVDVEKQLTAAIDASEADEVLRLGEEAEKLKREIAEIRIEARLCQRYGNLAATREKWDKKMAQAKKKQSMAEALAKKAAEEARQARERAQEAAQAQLEKFQALYDAAVAKLKAAISSAQADAILKAQSELKTASEGLSAATKKLTGLSRVASANPRLGMIALFIGQYTKSYNEQKAMISKQMNESLTAMKSQVIAAKKTGIDSIVQKAEAMLSKTESQFNQRLQDVEAMQNIIKEITVAEAVEKKCQGLKLEEKKKEYGCRVTELLMIKKGGEKSRKKAFAASKCIADSVEQQTVLEKACEAIESDTDRMLESRQAKKGIKAAAAAKKEEV